MQTKLLIVQRSGPFKGWLFAAFITLANAVFAAIPGEPVEYIGILAKERNVSPADGIVVTGSDKLSTPVKFRPPAEITFVAKTDSSDLRLGYAADQIIFNWKNNPSELRVDGGPANRKHTPDAGSIPRNEYVTIKWIVTPGKQQVFVDDKLRFEHAGDYSQIDNPITVFTYRNARVTVKSLTVICNNSSPVPVQNTATMAKRLAGVWVKDGREEVTLREDGTMMSSNGVNGTWKWVDEKERKIDVNEGKERIAYDVSFDSDWNTGTGKVHHNGQDVRKVGMGVRMIRAGTTTPVAKLPSSTPAPMKPAAAAIAPSTPALSASDLVRVHRSNLVFVTTADGAGSGFIANYGNGTYLLTNAHVAAGAKGALFKTLDGTQVEVGAPAAAVGHDIFLMALKQGGTPLQVMTGVDEHAAIGDEVVVLGNAEGAGVINTINGRIVGLGPNLVEVDAPFKPGNSGSPIIHLKTGKVVGVATYLTIRKYDSATNEAVKDPIVRRFGYRIDSVKKWEPVTWPAFYAQAAEMESIEKLTTDLVAFLRDLGKDGRVDRGAHTNPVIKSRIDQWLEARMKRLSQRDASMADQSLLSFLKITCQSDVTAAQQHLIYDYFRRQLEDQQRERTELARFFAKSVESMRQER